MEESQISASMMRCMRFSLCTDVTTFTPTSSRFQPQALEGNVQTLLVPDQDEAVFAARAAAARQCHLPIIAANCLLPARLPCVGTQVDRRALLAWVGTAVRRGAELGIGILVFGSGAARRIGPEVERATAGAQLAGFLAACAPLAQAAGVIIALEPLNPEECDHIFTLRDGAAVIRAIGHPNIRLLVDLYHAGRSGDTPADLAACLDLVVHVHVAEVQKRTAPGVMGDDFTPWFRVLHAGGYAGDLSIECGAKPGSAELDRAWEVLAQQWSAAAPKVALGVRY
jgi:sugar phosphate isomerase/epimerase